MIIFYLKSWHTFFVVHRLICDAFKIFERVTDEMDRAVCIFVQSTIDIHIKERWVCYLNCRCACMIPKHPNHIHQKASICCTSLTNEPMTYKTVFGSGFYLYTITDAQWYTFQNIQTMYLHGTFPTPFFLFYWKRQQSCGGCLACLFQHDDRKA